MAMAGGGGGRGLDCIKGSDYLGEETEGGKDEGRRPGFN
jgi:hypothetical protein